MNKLSFCQLVMWLSLGVSACSSDKNPQDKRPEAIVIDNEKKNNDAGAKERAGTDTAGLTATDPDTAIENYAVAGKDADEPDNDKMPDNTGRSNAARPATNTAAAGKKEAAGAQADKSNAGTQVAPEAGSGSSGQKAPVRRVVRTRASVQQQLARDARLATKMPLARFGRYMERRAHYYRGFGEVSYKDKTVAIKITDEELKIETPEGKYKRESDERKIKTSNGKIKQETRG